MNWRGKNPISMPELSRLREWNHISEDNHLSNLCPFADAWNEAIGPLREKLRDAQSSIKRLFFGLTRFRRKR